MPINSTVIIGNRRSRFTDYMSEDDSDESYDSDNYFFRRNLFERRRRNRSISRSRSRSSDDRTPSPRTPRGCTGYRGQTGYTGCTGNRVRSRSHSPRSSLNPYESITGPTGQKGQTGEPGPEGQKGQTGELGPTGEQGPQGQPGDQGQTGPPGDQGQTGPQGEQGQNGNLTGNIVVTQGPLINIISNNTDNINLTDGYSYYILKSPSQISSTISGFMGGINGRIIYLLNDTETTQTFVEESTNSLLSNRLRLSNPTINIMQNQTITFIYVTNLIISGIPGQNRWVMLSNT